MKCKDIQDQLLLNEKTEEMNSHIKECVECREFDKIVSVMHDDNINIGPSAELDREILKFAKENRPSTRQPIPFYIFTAVAALLVLGFVVMTFMNKNSEVSGKDLAESKNKKELIDTKKQVSVNVPATEFSDDLDRALETLWEDDMLSADMTTLEGELFVLSAELYSN